MRVATLLFFFRFWWLQFGAMTIKKFELHILHWLPSLETENYWNCLKAVFWLKLPETFFVGKIGW